MSKEQVLDFLHDDDDVALFIEGINLYSAVRNLSFDIDYGKLRRLFDERTRLVRAFYYTTILEGEEFNPLKPLVDWLDYNGFSMVTKTVRDHTDSSGRRNRRSMDVELCVDMLGMAEHINHAVLFSGDGDFKQLVAAVQRKGVKVTVVSTLKSSPPAVSDDLRRQADAFVDLSDLIPFISRDP